MKAALPKGPPQARPVQKPSQPAISLWDDEDEGGSAKGGNIGLPGKTGPMASTLRSSLNGPKEGLAEDSAVYAYDDVFDTMQAARERAAQAKKAQTDVKGPRYMTGLLATAAQRKIDRANAEQKKFAHEREMEGEAFDGQEAFVTEAYKQRMLDLKEAEQAEAARLGPFLPSFLPPSPMSHC